MALKTRAISKYNVAVNEQSGKVGNVRYFQKSGQTYVRAAHNRTDKGSNPRSDKQMRIRLKMVAMNIIFAILGNALET